MFRSLETSLHCGQTIPSARPSLLPLYASLASIAIGLGLLVSIGHWNAEFEQNYVL